MRDYKTGRVANDGIILDGGKELQRCLYAFAVKALLGRDVDIRASLLYPRDEADLRLEDPEGTSGRSSPAIMRRALIQSPMPAPAVLGADAGGDSMTTSHSLCPPTRRLPIASARTPRPSSVWAKPHTFGKPHDDSVFETPR